MKSYDHVILFGVNPKSIGLNVTLTKRVIRLENLTVIRSAALSRVATDQDEKRKLWQILKSIFS